MYYNSDREIFMQFIMQIGTNNSKDDKNYEWFMLAVRFRTTIILEYTRTLNLHKNTILKYISNTRNYYRK